MEWEKNFLQFKKKKKQTITLKPKDKGLWALLAEGQGEGAVFGAELSLVSERSKTERQCNFIISPRYLSSVLAISQGTA